MDKTLSLALRFLGVRRPAPPKTRFGRYLRRSERIVYGLLILYVGLHAFPQVLFAHSVTTAGITFYSRVPLPAEVTACASRAAGLLQRSELAVPGRQERVFVCNSPWLFSLFSPTSARAFAYSTPLTDHVFIAAADFGGDVAHSSAPDHNSRSLSAVVAHEITHGLIRRRLGFFRGVSLSPWVAEGYCDYVAREGSFPEAEGLRLMAAGQHDPSMSFRYFEYRQMLSYLLEGQHLSFAQVVSRADDFTAVEDETRRALQIRMTP